MIGFYEFRGMHLVSRLPRVVAFGVPFPLDKVLERSSSSMTSMTADLLHFILRFSCDKVRWGSGVVGAVSGRFAIG